MTSRVVEHATCLGCGCACDDIVVVVEDGRIVEARHACPLGAAWFGDGRVPARALVGGRETPLDEALDAAARTLAAAARAIVYLAPDLSCEAQREVVALADALRATLDSVTSATALPFVLAAQERGRAGATLGEVRNRGDVVVFWGVDPDLRYPRYRTRYAPDPPGLWVPEGRAARRVVAVDVGASRAPADADLRLALAADEEVATLGALRALLAPGAAQGVADERGPWAHARALAEVLRGARYAVIVADAEPQEGRDGDRAAALVAVMHALAATTRGALSTLRGGGNRSGADAVATAQTGFPTAVDLARGHPRYRPHDGALPRLARGEPDALLVVGDARLVPPEVEAALAGPRTLVVGPRASERALGAGAVAVDTGVAGIHDGGTAVRLDDVPLPLRPALDGPPAAAAVLRALRARALALRARGER